MKKNIYRDVLKVSILLTVLCPLFLGAQVTLDRQGKSPVAMKFQPGSQPTVASFFREYRQAYPLSDENQMKELRVSTDKAGSHYRYDQYYKGIQVLGAQYILHEKNGGVWYANGHLVHDLDLDVNPVLTKDQALQLALQNVKADEYMWENPQNELFIKKLQKKQDATYYPAGELLLTSGFKELASENMRLAWRFDVYASQPLGRYWVSVDAMTGEVFCKEDRIYDTDVPGSGLSLYNGTIPLTVQEIVPGSSYFLEEFDTRGADILTLNVNNEWDYSNVTDFEAASADGTWDPAAVNAHFGAEATYDFYLNEFGLNGIDGLGYAMISFVHLGVAYSDAYWDGAYTNFGDGDGVNLFPLVSLDVLGHEYTHGLTQFNANYFYYSESGALHESFSDIFGNLIEFSVEGVPGIGTGDWRVGEDFTANGLGFRNMADPNELYQPDTYLGNFWLPTNGGDNAGVHVNDGVPDYWFYLLSMGGTGVNDNGDFYDVTAIGLEDAAAIAYLNNTSFLSMYSNFQDARAGSIACAEILFGAGSQQALSNIAAWEAVGVYIFEVPENDLCLNAIELFCNDVVYGTTIGATLDPDAPWCDAEHTAPGVWYKFTGNDLTMLASMCGGPVYDARLTVYSGTCDDLTCVTANDDGCGGSSVSKAAWFAAAGMDYYLLVHGFASSIGAFSLSMTGLDTPDISASPEEFNFTVPYQGSDEDVLSLTATGEDCMSSLYWSVFNIEELIPPLLLPFAKGAGNTLPGVLPDKGLKDGIKTADGFKQNDQQGLKKIPSGVPVPLPGQGNNSGPESGRELNSSEVTVTITHSLDQSIISGNSAACFDGTICWDNHYWRAFNLSDFGIFSDFNVMSVEVGIEWAVVVYGDLQLIVNLYTSEGAPFPHGSWNLIGTATYAIEEQALTYITLPVLGTALAGSELVVEIFNPGGNLFWIGSNPYGQTGPTYISAPDFCGIYDPIDFADIGWPGVHMVMNVTGSFEPQCPWLSASPSSGSLIAGETQEVAINVDADGLGLGLYECNLLVRSNASNEGTMLIPVTMTVVDVTPPVISVAGPVTLWPPNHKYNNLDLSELVISVVDDVDGIIPVSSVVIESASSDEPDDAPGYSDGNTINDMVIASDCKSVDLRQERQDMGNGRVYTVWVSVSDAAGNVAIAPVLVTVPHDQYHAAIDDGPDHEVLCGSREGSLLTAGSENNIKALTELVNYPNPFNGTTTIQFTVENSGYTKLSVYNSLGVEVAMLYNGMAEAGHRYTLIFDGKNLLDGVYFCRLQSGDNLNTISRMLLIR